MPLDNKRIDYSVMISKHTSVGSITKFVNLVDYYGTIVVEWNSYQTILNISKLRKDKIIKSIK